MLIGKKFAGDSFMDVTGKCKEPVVIDQEGWGDFRVDGGSVSTWVPKRAYEYLETELD